VLLSGEPGIGKTRLATEAARTLHAEGATVLLGTCDEDASLPYQPFVEALRHYVAHAPDEVLRAHVQEHRGELGRLIPELGRRVADLPPPQVAEAETERYMLFDAVAGLFSAASQHAPVVLVLDDLHWARARAAAAAEAPGALGDAAAAPRPRHLPRLRPDARPPADLRARGPAP
jgi:predicted ATPase